MVCRTQKFVVGRALYQQPRCAFFPLLYTHAYAGGGAKGRGTKTRREMRLDWLCIDRQIAKLIRLTYIIRKQGIDRRAILAEK